MSVAAADEPEPTIADLINEFRLLTERLLAEIAKFGQQPAAAQPEPLEELPDGLDAAGPMRPSLCDEDGE
jgi:hypothetical protein